MKTKEQTIMNQACLSIIRMDWRINFVGIVDQNGKLLIGKGRADSSERITGKLISSIKNSIANSKVDDVYSKYKSMYLFYCDYLLWIIQKFTVSLGEREHKYDFPYATEGIVPSYFEVSGCNEDNVELAVASLDLSMRKFLCIYFEPAYNIRSSIGDTEKELEHLLSKVVSTVF